MPIFIDEVSNDGRRDSIARLSLVKVAVHVELYAAHELLGPDI